MVPLTSRIVLLPVLLTCAACSEALTMPAGPAPAPVITQPVCGAITRWPDRPVTLAWNPVTAASSYDVELDCMNCGNRREPWVSQSGTPWMVEFNLERPEFTIDVTATVRREGGSALRWRVWANDRDGDDGTKTDWCVIPFSDSGLPVPGASITKSSCNNPPKCVAARP